MISAWTKHLKTDEEKDRLKTHILGSKPVLNRLKELVSEELDGLDQRELNDKIYDLPNWDYRQAHGNGYRQAMKVINKIITLDQEENNGRQPI